MYLPPWFGKAMELYSLCPHIYLEPDLSTSEASHMRGVVQELLEKGRQLADTWTDHTYILGSGRSLSPAAGIELAIYHLLT